MTVLRFAEVGSTQDALAEAAAAGAPAGTAVVARVQSGGRGSRGQRWQSPEGGLWLSVLLRPPQATAMELASVRAGLAVAAALDALGPVPPLQLKWPNDLLLNGRKVGGVLVEAQWTGGRPDALLVGVGLNVRNAPPADTRWPATALAEWLPAVQVDAVLQMLLSPLRSLDLARPLLTPAELQAFAARHALAGCRISAPVAGVVGALGADGTLAVQRDDGTTERLRSGPIVPAAAAAPA